jgi:triacylglycerol lipase
MTLELVSDGRGDARNGRYLGTACDLVYLNGSACSDAFREKLGLDGQLVSVNNTQVFVGSDSKNIVAVFRGSESPNSLDGFKDWFLTNAVNFLILPEGRMGVDFAAAGVAARFHQGFMAALGDIWDPFFAAIDGAYQKEERPVWVSGHSLGGALALLAAWRLERQGVPVHQVVTFGSPMIGNVAGSRAASSATSIRSTSCRACPR